MREVKVQKVDMQVMERISVMYAQLKVICLETARLREAGLKDFEDLFHDCILTVAQDDRASDKTGDELTKHFCYRFNMILFQNVKDNNQEKAHINASNTKIGRQEAEEDL